MDRTFQPGLPMNRFLHCALAAAAARLADYDVRPWTGVFVPAKTPPAIARRLADDMMEVLAMPDVRTRMDHLGMELALQPTTAFESFLAEEARRWDGVLRKARLSIQ